MTDKKPLMIDLNNSNEKEIAHSLNISIRLARRIISMRPYNSVEDLNRIWGLDDDIRHRIQSLAFFSPKTSSNLRSDEESGIYDKEKIQPTTTSINDSLDYGDSEDIQSGKDKSRELLSQELPSKVVLDESIDETKPKISWKINFILILILMVAAYFRFNGINWDDNHHMQPDERYITMVADQIRSVSSISEYFNTATSTLNPLNHGSYTYGMLPLFITRAVAVLVGMANYDGITLVGRFMSGLFDLAAVWMLYLLGKRIFNRRTGILAAALAAAAVLPIQLSHYLAVDSFSTVFVVASFYFALQAVPLTEPEEKFSRLNLVSFGVFGFIVGLAGACKVNTIPVFGVIILAGLARLITSWKTPIFRSNLKFILAGWGLSFLFMAVAFRIFQPYAFAGPGFFGLALNERWLSVIKEVTGQVAGRSEWPPNHHWTNRPLTYGWTNMVVWGLGIPLGVAGWIGWCWAGIRIWKGDWRQHLLPFTWVTAYFIWQNLQFWRYMRYFLPIYPFIILFAAWALLRFYDQTSEGRKRLFNKEIKLKINLAEFKSNWKAVLSLVLIGCVLVGTYVWAFSFSRIYDRTLTRIEASHWILENFPGPFNLIVEMDDGELSYPVSVYNQLILEPNDQPNISINVDKNGTSSQITTTDIRQLSIFVYFRLTKDESGEQIVTEGRLGLTDEDTLENQVIKFGDIVLDEGTTYYLHYKIYNSGLMTLKDVHLSNENDDNPKIPINLDFQDQNAGVFEGLIEIKPEGSYRLNRLSIGQIKQEFYPSESTLQVSLFTPGNEDNPLAITSTKLNFDQPGLKLQPIFKFEPVQLSAGQAYMVRYEILEGGPLQIKGESFTLETSWDDALPLSVNGINALGGVYNPNNLELYEPDTTEKRDQMINILDESNYIVISSNRAYDSMPRLPLRYPMTTKYYQALFDCECTGDELENQAYSLEPPFKSPLGFELVKVFTSNPGLGPISINDQTADESFTVYDHPKVLIFKKSKDFSIEKVRDLLYSVNLDEVIFQSPMAYTKAPTAMELSQDQLITQTNGGTWSEMFNRNSWLNTNQYLAVVVWYLMLLLIGWLVFPIVYRVFSGLPDRGYGLIRMMGMLLVSWLAWIMGSLNLLPFTQWTIVFCILLIGAASVFLIYRNRHDFVNYLTNHWKQFLGIEVIFLVIFIFSLYVRLGNPDLWQPWLGGEKPMEFAFFNAILKTVHFPPEHPWFSGHYINYYYYGYVIAAIPTKLLGIMPSIAFNLILPSWFAMTGIGVYSAGYNLFAGFHLIGNQDESEPPIIKRKPLLNWFTKIKAKENLAIVAGLLALVFVLFVGNLYEVRILWRYLPEASSVAWDGSSIFGRTNAFINGAKQVLTTDQELPGNSGRWYFDASRPILHDGPDTPIAEFPYFTFLYGDMHPHLLAMPIYGLVFGWLLSVLLTPLNKIKWKDRILSLFMGGIIFGSFRATHTWDYPTYIALGILVLFWMIWQVKNIDFITKIKHICVYVLTFVGFSVILYWPFSHWFRTEYVSLEIWKGARTPLFDYLSVFGVFLFVMISLMVVELYSDIRTGYKKWMESSGWKIFIPGILLLVLISIPYILSRSDYKVLAFAFPLLIAIFYLIFIKRELTFLQRLNWWLFGIGFGITFVVEVLVLKGDSGRSNMVFRMYNQAWFILGLALSLAIMDIVPKVIKKTYKIKITWFVTFFVLVACVFAYPLIATGKKMNDRWPAIQNPPHTLDGALFMLGEDPATGVVNPAIYSDEGRIIDLSKDYAGIKYMQDFVPGTPVIVEGQTQEYRWGARYSIHTGLPTVIGWNWHVRQHNSLLDGSIVENRIREVAEFYNTDDIQAALEFLNKYEVQYIIVSDLERVYYSEGGISKFELMAKEGVIKRVFGDGTNRSATIYMVNME